ncbi:hypothetical protein [Novosphingopyxis baekryungensis]|uniref:hypothetical protein n=1 Tax=Novosphingopyxis baekryungensis TaxID=279369 RepID=UPI0012EBB089|nr:hypothetical protein [Novosphingopyxis baekryungensis]
MSKTYETADASSTKGGSRRKLTKAGSKRSRQWADAKRLSNSPLAEDISNAEPKPPPGFGNPQYRLPRSACEEIVKKATDAVRKAKRNAGAAKGVHVVNELARLFNLDHAERTWLIAWVNYLNLWPQIVVEGKYRSGARILAALGLPVFPLPNARQVPSPAPAQVPTSTPSPSPAPIAPAASNQSSAAPPPPPLPLPASSPPLPSPPPPQTTTGPIATTAGATNALHEGIRRMDASSGQGSTADAGSAVQTGAPTSPHGSTVQQNIPPASPAPSMGSTAASILPPTPREVPVTFIKLSNSNGKTFCRAYWESNDLSEVRAKARALAADSVGLFEIRNHSAVAEKFLIETMQKLGVSLP